MLPHDITIEPEALFKLDFNVKSLGEARLQTPLQGVNYVKDSERINLIADPGIVADIRQRFNRSLSFLAAGPRERIFHDPAWTRAAIVTCGGLCPGLNDVIKGLVNTLWYLYGVRNIFGIRYGYAGLNPACGHEPIKLDPDVVDNIHTSGGTILSSSRGAQDPEEMVRTLDRMNINILFTIGGDGTQRGAHAIAQECQRRRLPISVIGVPKTIDNDLNFMDKTFGFDTAVQSASAILSCAHSEAKGCPNGVGLVKLMGRDSGFTAAYASLANSVVNFCLIPEVPFKLEGPGGLLEALRQRLLARHHAVIVVSEGAGQDLMEGEQTRDKSGNLLHRDIGQFLKARISAYLAEQHLDSSVKYFDPSYEIRSLPANSGDSVFCLLLAQNAVHAAMAGMTDAVVANWNSYYTYMPIEVATAARRKVSPCGQLWQSVLFTTRQDQLMSGQREIDTRHS